LGAFGFFFNARNLPIPIELQRKYRGGVWFGVIRAGSSSYGNIPQISGVPPFPRIEVPFPRPEPRFLAHVSDLHCSFCYGDGGRTRVMRLAQGRPAARPRAACLAALESHSESSWGRGPRGGVLVFPAAAMEASSSHQI
jgi:hypothetical protein